MTYGNNTLPPMCGPIEPFVGNSAKYSNRYGFANPGVNYEKIALAKQVIRLKEEGLLHREIAIKLEMSTSNVGRIIKEHKKELNNA